MLPLARGIRTSNSSDSTLIAIDLCPDGVRITSEGWVRHPAEDAQHAGVGG
jgi:hypothetical protein